MKKVFTAFLLLFFLFGFSNNRKIIVAFSLNDCISGSASLHELNQILKNPEMTIVFQSELKADSILVKKKTGVDNFKSSVVIYSDSLYNKYSNGVKSTINIIENNRKIYSTDLYKLNIEDFLNIYLTAKNNCFKSVKSGARFIQDDKSILVWSAQLGRWTYYDENMEFDIIADDSWVKKAYSICYKGGVIEKKYKEYENLIKDYPALNPVINKGIKINDKELLFMITVHFTETKNNSDKDAVVQKIFLVSYNIKTQEISSMKYVNEESLSKNKYYINNSSFNTFEDNYIITLTKDEYTESGEIKYLALFQINKNNPNELILKEILDSNIPNNYIKYKLYHNFNSYHFDKSLVLLDFGEFIYDYKKNIQYKIPLPESEFNTLNNVFEALTTGKLSTYNIDDIADKGNTILLLYRDSSKKLKLMEIDKKSQKAIKDIVIMSAQELEPHFSSWFTVNAEGEIYYLNNKNCIVKIQV